jgi:hypothetical protein
MKQDKHEDMVFIKGNVPSLKNSKPNGKWLSQTVVKYLRSHGIKSFSSGRREVVGYKTRPMTFPVEDLHDLFKDVSYPVEICFWFVRGSKHLFDFNNANALLFDLFTAFKIIPDDSTDYVVPRCTIKERKTYEYNKERPGVEITINQI